MLRRKSYPILFVLFLATIIFSCNKGNIFVQTPVISSTDSLVFSTIENDISFNRLDTALIKIQKLEESDNFKSNILFKVYVFNLKARILTRQKKYQSALDVVNEMLANTDTNIDFLKIAYSNANSIKGDIYFELRNYPAAYKYYYEGQKSIVKQSDNCSFAQYDYRIAIILYKQQKYISSIDIFKKSYKKYNICGEGFGEHFRMQELLSNIGLCYFKLQQFDSALVYYDRAKDFLVTIKGNDISQNTYLKIGEGVIEGNKGKVLLKLGRNEEAIKCLKKNIEINSKIDHDRNDAITSIVALSNYYLSISDYKSFNNTINIADSINKSPRYREQFRYVYDLKSKYYSKINNYKLAYEYNLLFSHIEDSLSLLNQKNNDSDVQLTLESLEKENQINELIKESQSRNFYIYIIVTISIVLLILIITISVFLKYANKKNSELNNSNREVNIQKELLNKANEEITYNLEVLKTRDLEKNKILSIVAHDLRNPNNAIISIVDSLLENGNLTQEQTELINLISTSAHSNNDLIQEVLYFAKPGQFNNSSDLVTINCKELLTQTISLNYYKASQKHITIVLGEIDPRLFVTIHIEKIRRAISNVIINAIKFSHHNTKISIYSTNTLETINIHIKDQGIGIPDRIKNAVFISDPIIRRLGTDGEASFGLGLSIVKQILEEHNGKISFQSSNNGTEFIISLPLSKQIS